MSETTTSAAPPYAEQAVLAAAVARGEPGWLLERRAEAARAFAAAPLPAPALRPWRYTDVTRLDLTAFAPAETPIAIEGGRDEGGAYAGTLAGALEGHGRLIADRLGALIPATEGKFVAANGALWSGGALVHTPAGAAFEEPVVVTIDASELEDAAVHPRLLIEAGEQSELTVVLRTRSGDAPLLAFGVVEINVAQAARVRLLIDDRWGAATQDFTTIRARLGRDADLQVASLAIGGAILKQTVEVTLEGEGATPRSTRSRLAMGTSTSTS